MIERDKPAHAKTATNPRTQKKRTGLNRQIIIGYRAISCMVDH